MRSSPQSIEPPPSFDEADGWRAVFLLLVPDERRRDAVQGMGRLLGNLLMEAGPAFRSDEPVRAYLHAAAHDLRHTQYVLALEGQSSLEHEPDAALLQFTRRMARKIGKLAAELEALFQ